MFATIVEIWPRGYADRDGPTKIGFKGTLSPACAEREVRSLPGLMFASVMSTMHFCTHDEPFPRERFSEEYRNTMSRNDNS